MGQSATPESAPSCKSIYVASAEGDTGKSAIALGLLALLIATSGRVGVFRPIFRAEANGDRDRILELLMEYASADLDYDDCLGVTYDDVHVDPDAAVAEIVARFHAVEERCDAVLILGSDYTDIGNPSELSFNARVAANLSAPVVLALRAVDQTPQTLRAHADLLIGEIAAAHATTAVLIANRCDPAQLKQITAALAGTGVQSWALPEDPILVAPTMGELKEALGAELYSGDPELLDREALRVMVGGMTVEHILERITDGTVVITPADRSDVLLSLVNANVAQGFPRLTGIILNGGLRKTGTRCGTEVRRGYARQPEGSEDHDVFNVDVCTWSLCVRWSDTQTNEQAHAQIASSHAVDPFGMHH